MKEIHIEEIVKAVNTGAFRRSSIPAELASGWPCVHYMGKTPCVTIPYFLRKLENEKVALYPLYCSVTVPLGNPDRILDFTVFPYRSDWRDIDYKCPAGYFRHAALANVTRSQYKQMCQQLFACYDNMIVCMLMGCDYQDGGVMTSLFTALMEPCLYEQYLKINKQFYMNFVKL